MRLKVFSGNANRPLAEEICQHLNIEIGKANTSRFSDGEFNFQILENVRGEDCFILQPTCPPVDANLMELLIMLDAFRRSSAKRITAVIPYYGYARKDRKDRPRVPISSKLIANLITKAGADRVLLLDLHAGQIQGFFDIPADHLYAAPVLVGYFQGAELENLTVVAPDAGGVERARAYAKRLGAELAIIDKRRDYDRLGEVEVLHVVGDVEGRTALTLLSKPISRREFVLGKFLGIVWANLLMFIVLGAWMLILVSYKVVYDARETANPEPAWQLCAAEMTRIVPGMVLSFLETVVMTAISVAISTRLPMLVNLVVCIAIFFLGHLSPVLVEATSQGNVNELVSFMAKLFAQEQQSQPAKKA